MSKPYSSISKFIVPNLIPDLLNLANKFFARMGLSIHYSGTISQYSLIDELVEEVADICKDLNWPYRIWKDEESADTHTERNNQSALAYKLDDLKGISVSPEGSEVN